MPHTQSIVYDLRFDAHAQHLVNVEMVVPASAGRAHDSGEPSWSVDVAMPVWAPGSYMVREFARHVQEVHVRRHPGAHGPGQKTAVSPATASARDRATEASAAPTVTKIDKRTWRITAPEPMDVCLSYRVWGRELTVRSTCIEQDFALLQGAATYLSPPSAYGWPHEVRVHLPEAYAQVVCGLPINEADHAHVFVARNFDELVDTPLALGDPNLQHFEVQGVPHTLATFGDVGLFDCARAGRDFAAIAHCTAEMFGHVPYERYVMINLLYGGQGGLEHRHSAVIMASPWAARKPEVYRNFLGLVAHEHFHAWNIKRLRPEALGPFDYGQENYTESLWVAEGLTAFYDNLMVLRAGLCDAKQYLSALAQDMARLATTPGRTLQTLGQSSFDAWIKFYRRDENSDNTSVSYYLKGAIVGMLLNADIIAASDGRKCLDDVMRLAYKRYSGARGYSEAQFRACAYDVCPTLSPDFFSRAIDGLGELDTEILCRTFGIVSEPSGLEASEDLGAGERGGPSVTLGLQVKEVEGRVVVTQVQDGEAGSAAGLQADDEIIAIDGRRMSQTTLGYQLQVTRPSQTLKLLVCRYGAIKTVALVARPAPNPKPKWLWHKAPDAAQRAARRLWLGPRAQEPG